MIRIVHVTGSAGWAGGERQLSDLVARLDAGQIQCEVICPTSGPLVSRLAARGVRVHVVNLSPLGNPVAVRRLANTLSAIAPDLVQSHGARSNFYARVACRLTGVRHVSTVHNALADYPVSHARKRLYMFLDRLSGRWTERVVCVSKSLRDDVIRQGIPPDKVSVIYNGVDCEVFDPQRANPRPARQEWGDQGILLGLIGRMTDQKGHRYLLDALPNIVRRFPGVKAIFVGDGPLREMLGREVTGRGLADHVRFAGVRDRMPDVLAAMDLVVLPSVSEGLPYVLLEALAMERPTVVSDVNGVREVLLEDGRGARLVPPRDPDALAAAIISILSNPQDAQRMAQEGRERVRKAFDVDTMVKRWEDLYRELAVSA